MPDIQSFQIKNFKGIELVDINLRDRASSPVITLIGLNESGKTTILEALSHFVTGDKSVSGLFEGIHAQASGAGLIPVNKKAAFTSTIEVKATVLLDETDLLAAQQVAKSFGLVLDAEALAEPWDVSKVFSFEDSVLKSTSSLWDLRLMTRTSRAKQFKEYERPDGEGKSLWLELVNRVQAGLPRISYFPTFLVDMPARIYLAEHDNEKPVNRHYRYVFQDILNSLGEGLTLDRHVCKRIADFKAAQKATNWFSVFFGGPNREPVDSVFQKISHAVTKEVLGSWQRIFQRAISAKGILVEWNIDTEKGDLPYASFYVSDGESRYAISERSLGFRWFFSFLLFTAFKQAKKQPTIFIFDEPAANLHAKAQAELLTSFSRIASDGNKIIYSTHSHHMINPQWLSGAYIVENAALDYDMEDSFGLSTKPTNIKAWKYRDFVSQYPSRSSYFQPVIEKLEYVTPEVLGSSPFVLVEGVSDYLALQLASKLAGLKTKFSLLPGVGSGACGPQISLMMGRGEKFLILLDDDKAGRKESERYKEGWFLSDDVVMTLGQLDPAFEGRQLEGLLTDESLLSVQRHLRTSKAPSKKQLGWYLAEMCAAATIPPDCLAAEGKKNLLKVLSALDAKFT